MPRFAVLLLALLAALTLGFTPPPLSGHVVDTAGKLAPAEAAAIDAELETLRARTGVAIVVFLPRSLEGEPVEDVAHAAFNAWGVGARGKDDGVLLVIAPAERRARIETGRGVGGALTDLQSNDILRTRVVPRLREDRWGDAVRAGVSGIEAALVAGGVGTTPERAPSVEEAPSLIKVVAMAGGLVLLVVLLAVSPRFRSVFFQMLQFAFVASMFGRRGGGGRGGGGGGYSGGGGRSGGGGSSEGF